ncbi:hypothetical protein KM043_010099 [Ampulex compressa]|nr:hypothetical protein KM043_010099 [Ampulex compressa]
MLERQAHMTSRAQPLSAKRPPNWDNNRFVESCNNYWLVFGTTLSRPLCLVNRLIMARPPTTGPFVIVRTAERVALAESRPCGSAMAKAGLFTAGYFPTGRPTMPTVRSSDVTDEMIHASRAQWLG